MAAKKITKGNPDRTNSNVLRLVPIKPAVDDGVVHLIRDLLFEACRGDVTGLALVVMHRSDEYTCHVVGEARNRPTLARGMVRVLDDKIRERIG